MSALLLLLACTGGDRLPKGGDRPDVVLVSVDTLRADHVGVYGYARDTTPFLDALATRGTRFAHARSPSPWTLPTHATMLSGLLPNQHLVVDATLRIGDDTPLLAEAMAAAGYATGGFVSTIFVGRRFGFDRGFETFEDFDLRSEKENLSGSIDAEQVIDAALAFTRREAGRPVFLFIHLYDVHYPYAAPPPWDTRFDRAGQKGDARYRKYSYHRKHRLSDEQLAHQVAQYDEEIRYVDDQLARLSAAFEQAGRAPVMLVTADHGEEFYERGSWGHAHTLNPEQLHVPLILAGPDVPAGVVVDTVVGTQDIAPTLARRAGAAGFDGVDLLGPLPERDFLSDTSRFTTNRLGLWSEGLRLDWDLSADRVALYADAAEAADVAAERPDDASRMRARLQAALGSPWEAVAPGPVESEGAVLVDGRRERGPLAPGTRFAVVPVDAPVHAGGQGPWAAAGGVHPPEGAPLRLEGQRGVGTTALDEATRARLEALGYVQSEDDE